MPQFLGKMKNFALNYFPYHLKRLPTKNPLYFKYIRKKFYKGCEDKSTQLQESEKQILNTIERDGLCIFPNYFSKEWVANIHQEIKEHISKIALDASFVKKSDIKILEKGHIARYYHFDDYLPSTKKFFDDDMINRIAQAYVGDKASSFQRMYELKSGPGHLVSTDYYHLDTWEHRFKAFIYLTDVEISNAPFVYLKRSHKGPWRFAKEYDYYRGDRKSVKGNFTPVEVRNLINKYKFEEILCTGKAGTLILFDARGIHRGHMLMQGDRPILANYFAYRNFFSHQKIQ